MRRIFDILGELALVVVILETLLVYYLWMVR